MNETRLAAGQFFGLTDRAWRTKLVTLTVLRHATPRIVPLHRHEHMYIALLLEGGYREWVADREIIYEPLTAVFHPARLEHRDEITKPDSLFFMIELAPSLVDALDQVPLRSIHDLSGGPAIWSMLRLLDAIEHRHDELDGEEPVVEILEQLLDTAPNTPPPPWLGEIEQHLRDHYAEPTSLRALAELAGVHPVHLARVFRRHHGCTMRAYLHARRTLHASRKIAAGMSLAEVALDAGFCDQSHLTHVFKTITGMTPMQYRSIRSARSVSLPTERSR